VSNCQRQCQGKGVKVKELYKVGETEVKGEDTQITHCFQNPDSAKLTTKEL